MTDDAQNEILRLRRELVVAYTEREEWARQCSEWKRHAKRLEREIISSNEYRAFIRGILVVAVEALEENPPHPDQLHAVVAKEFRHALTDIRDMILPPDDRRREYALLAEQKAMAETAEVCPNCGGDCSIDPCEA